MAAIIRVGHTEEAAGKTVLSVANWDQFCLYALKVSEAAVAVEFKKW